MEADQNMKPLPEHEPTSTPQATEIAHEPVEYNQDQNSSQLPAVAPNEFSDQPVQSNPQPIKPPETNHKTATPPASAKLPQKPAESKSPHITTAITATVIIVIVLALIAVFAYLKQP